MSKRKGDVILRCRYCDARLGFKHSKSCAARGWWPDTDGRVLDIDAVLSTTAEGTSTGGEE